MSAGRKRIDTIRAQFAGVRTRLSSEGANAIDAELTEAARVNRAEPERRRHLLQIIHSCRALDTTLKEILLLHQLTDPRSMGPRLSKLPAIPSGKLGHIEQKECVDFHQAVCKPRNEIVHDANAYPKSTYEAAIILGDIQTCFLRVLQGS